jgi:hypothetical protein
MQLETRHHEEMKELRKQLSEKHQKEVEEIYDNQKILLEQERASAEVL